jgi:hypothetical protein
MARPIQHERSTEATIREVSKDLRARKKFEEARKLYEDVPSGEASKDLAPAEGPTTKSAIERQNEMRKALEEEERIRKERERKARGE